MVRFPRFHVRTLLLVVALAALPLWLKRQYPSFGAVAAVVGLPAAGLTVLTGRRIQRGGVQFGISYWVFLFLMWLEVVVIVEVSLLLLTVLAKTFR